MSLIWGILAIQRNDHMNNQMFIINKLSEISCFGKGDFPKFKSCYGLLEGG